MNAIYTPWGQSQTRKVIDAGIEFVSTARHGGFKLFPVRWAELMRRFPDFQPFNGNDGWLEEDCDAALAPLCWPRLFGAQAVWAAHRQVINEPWAKGFWASNIGKDVLTIAKSYGDEISGMWERGGLAGGGDLPRGTWRVYFHRDGKSRTVLMPYPTKQFYADSELDAIEQKAG